MYKFSNSVLCSRWCVYYKHGEFCGNGMYKRKGVSGIYIQGVCMTAVYVP